jgi:hypothetical protein
MGTLTIQVVGDATVGTKSKAYVISDADVNRLVAYCKAAYPIVTTNPTTGVTTTSVPTVAQALVSWADGFVAGTKANVQRFETPVPAVPAPITAT